MQVRYWGDHQLPFPRRALPRRMNKWGGRGRGDLQGAGSGAAWVNARGAGALHAPLGCGRSGWRRGGVRPTRWSSSSAAGSRRRVEGGAWRLSDMSDNGVSVRRGRGGARLAASGWGARKKRLNRAPGKLGPPRRGQRRRHLAYSVTRRTCH